MLAVSQTEHYDIDKHATQLVGLHITQGNVISVEFIYILIVLLQYEQILLLLT